MKRKYRIHYQLHKSWCISSSTGMLIGAYFGSIADAMSHLSTLSKLRAI